MFVWKRIHNSIGVKECLANRGIPSDTSCPLCHDHAESISHALRDCHMVKPLWHQLGFHNSSSLFFSQDIKTWLTSNANSRSTCNINGVPWHFIFCFAIWLIWKQRNQVVFNNKGVNPNLRKVITMQAAEYVLCVTQPRYSNCMEIRQVRWEKPNGPNPGWVKLNTDRSSDASSSNAGGGGLIRGEQGNWVIGFTRKVGKANSFLAEIWALRDGLILCNQLNLNAVMVELDAKALVDALNNPLYVNSIISSLFDDCRRLAAQIPHLSIKHIYCEANRIITDFSGMGLEERPTDVHKKNDKTDQTGTICVHAFSDLTYISPVVFLYLLKECYTHGTLKATTKFRALQHQVYQVLHNDPQPGPSTFVIQCLYVLPIFGIYCEGFSHLIVSALRRYLKSATNQADSLEAKDLAGQLFLDIVGGFLNHDERIVLKILEVFDVKLINIGKFMCHAKETNDSSGDAAKKFVEQYIFGLVESQSYMTAVSLLEQFSIRQSGKSFLFTMIQSKEFKAADKWATFMGKQMLCVLVQEYIDRNLLKHAYDIIKKNNLRQEFPDVYHKCKESSLKKLAEKGCWEVAEAKTNGDRQLLEYLVYLAMEAGYSEKVDELCDRYSLTGFLDVKVPEASLLQNRFLHLNELAVEEIIWVDEVDGLRNATCHIEGCKVLGLDCEWKPNYEKGSKPNKVSIMQIASDKMVFIFDLIKLFEDVPDVLDNCLARILQSPSILKLGYNFQCDVRQLAHSYGDLECFKHFEMLLDVQNVFKEPRGGLSGLAKKILGAGLNKTRRNSNWEQRPLTKNQLEYAALDAVVLIHIFRHIGSHSQPATGTEGHEKIEWKSYIVSQMDNIKKPKKGMKSKKQPKEAQIDEHCQSS